MSTEKERPLNLSNIIERFGLVLGIAVIMLVSSVVSFGTKVESSGEIEEELLITAAPIQLRQDTKDIDIVDKTPIIQELSNEEYKLIERNKEIADRKLASVQKSIENRKQEAIREKEKEEYEMLVKQSETYASNGAVAIQEDPANRGNRPRGLNVGKPGSSVDLSNTQNISLEGTNGKLPNASTKFKSYMDWTKVTARGSRQYKVLHEGGGFIDEFGFRRRANGDYFIALGSAWARSGNRVRVTLDNGVAFNATLGDAKSDRDTDPTNSYRVTKDRKGNLIYNVVEFLVEPASLPVNAKSSGNVGVSNNGMFSGNVVSIQIIQ